MSFPVVNHHNPDCGTSRNVLGIIRAAGYQPTVIDYLTTGWTRPQLLALFAAATITPQQALRIARSPAEAMGLTAPGVSDDQLLNAMIAHPILVILKAERTPQAMARENTSLGMSGRQWTRMQALRHWLFWLTLPALLGPAAWNTAFFFHQVHFAEAKGWAHFDLVTLFPIYTVTGVGSMLLTGWLVDRFGSAKIAGNYLFPIAIGYLLLGSARGLGLAAVGMVLMGLSVGAHMTMSAALWAEFYGTANLGRIRAMAGAFGVLGTALGAGICGWLIDLDIDLPQQTVGISVYFVIAAILAAIGGRRA